MTRLFIVLCPLIETLKGIKALDELKIDSLSKTIYLMFIFCISDVFLVSLVVFLGDN